MERGGLFLWERVGVALEALLMPKQRPRGGASGKVASGASKGVALPLAPPRGRKRGRGAPRRDQPSGRSGPDKAPISR